MGFIRLDFFGFFLGSAHLKFRFGFRISRFRIFLVPWRLFPFVEQARVCGAHEGGEPAFHFLDGFVFERAWHRLGKHFPGVREVAEEDSLAAFEVVAMDVSRKRVEVLIHLAGDAFRLDVFEADPRMVRGKLVEGVVNKVTPRLRVFEFLEFSDAFLERHACGLEFGHLLSLEHIELAAQDDFGVFQDRLDQRHHLKRIERPAGIEQRKRVDEIERERVVKREVRIEIDAEPQPWAARAGGWWNDLDDSSIDERAEELPGALEVKFFAFGGSWQSAMIWRIARQPSPGRLSTCRSMPWVTRNRETSGSGGAATSFRNVSTLQLTNPSGGFRFTSLLAFAGSVAARASSLRILDDMRRGHRHHKSDVIKPFAPGPSGKLVELARGERGHRVAAEFAQPRQEHRADRDVDTHAKRVGSADQLEQPALSELLDRARDTSAAVQHGAGRCHGGETSSPPCHTDC